MLMRFQSIAANSCFIPRERYGIRAPMPKLFIALLSIFASSPFGYTQIMEGSYSQDLYRRGEKIESLKGEFIFEATDRRYYLRIDCPNSRQLRKIFISSDYTDVYQCQILDDLDPPKVGTQGIAKFKNGVMPNGFAGWGVSEVLILAFLSVHNPKTISMGNQLNPDVIPEFITRRAADSSLLLQTEIQLSGEQISVIKFWGTPARAGEMVSSKVLVGILEINAVSAGVPSSVTYKNNSLARQPDGTYIVRPLSIFYYNSEVKSKTSSNFETVGSYDPKLTTYVADERFAEAPKFTYVLKPGPVQLPFKGEPSYNKLLTELHAYVAEKDVARAKAHLIVFAMFVSVAPFVWLTKIQIRGKYV